MIRHNKRLCACMRTSCAAGRLLDCVPVHPFVSAPNKRAVMPIHRRHDLGKSLPGRIRGPLFFFLPTLRHVAPSLFFPSASLCSPSPPVLRSSLFSLSLFCPPLCEGVCGPRYVGAKWSARAFAFFLCVDLGEKINRRLFPRFGRSSFPSLRSALPFPALLSFSFFFLSVCAAKKGTTRMAAAMAIDGAAAPPPPPPPAPPPTQKVAVARHHHNASLMGAPAALPYPHLPSEPPRQPRADWTAPDAWFAAEPAKRKTAATEKSGNKEAKLPRHPLLVRLYWLHWQRAHGPFPPPPLRVRAGIFVPGFPWSHFPPVSVANHCHLVCARVRADRPASPPLARSHPYAAGWQPPPGALLRHDNVDQQLQLGTFRTSS